MSHGIKPVIEMKGLHILDCSVIMRKDNMANSFLQRMNTDSTNTSREVQL